MVDVLKLIAEGENEYIEFKERPKDLAKEICAMANAKGGFILIGITDDKKLKGVNPEQAKEVITNSLINLRPAPRINIQEVEINKKKIVVVEVKKSDELVTLGGVAYIRIGRGIRAMELSEVLAVLSETVKMEFDEMITEVPLNEADKGLISWLLEERKKRGFGNGRALKALRLVKGKKLTFAGVLFLHKHPQEIFPQTAIRILWENGEWKRIDGPFKELFEKTFPILKNEITTVILSRHGVREEMPTYSEKAFREALVNALVHRNYSLGAEIIIRISKQMISIENPGGFPPGVNPESPKPFPRNRWIYETAFQTGYVEKIGSGIDLIKEEAKKNPFFSVEFRIERFWTKVIFKREFPELSETEHRLLELLDEPRTSGELVKSLGLSKPTVLRYLKHLEQMGLVKSLGKARGRRWAKS